MNNRGLCCSLITLFIFYFTIVAQAEPPTNLDPYSPFLPSIGDTSTKLSQLGNVHIKKIIVTGNTIFQRKDFDFILKSYENRKVKAEELHEIKNKLTLFYISKGFVNSGCILEDQKIENGEITYHIIEGVLGDIFIEGNERLKDNFISNRIKLSTGDAQKPFNINDLQNCLKILKQEPVIKNINTYVRPGMRKGKAQLKVNVQETKPYNFTVECHNHNAPGIGSYRGDLKFKHLNVLGWADPLSVQYGFAEGLHNYLLDYQIPINRQDTKVRLKINHSQTRVVAKTYSPLDIQGDSTSFTFGISHFLTRTPSTEFKLGLELEKRESHTEMRGKRISLSLGVEDGTSKVSVFRFTQQWLHRSLNQVIAIHSAFNIGLDAFNATIHSDESIPDGKFKTWLGQFQYIRRLSFLNSQLVTSLDMRFSDDPMLAIEKFAIGGYSTVRGYRENFIISDSGYVASLEWKIPVGKYQISGISKKDSDGQIEICPFWDYGKGSNHNKDTDLDPDQIYSAGLGFRWQIASSIFAELYLGWALKDVIIEADDDIQDDGIHFMISYQ